jgi:beta-lactamase class A
MTSASAFKRLLATTLFGVVLAGCGSASRPSPPAVAPMHQAEGFLSIPVPPPLPRTPRPAPASLVNAISELQSGFQGKAGIAVRAVDDGWTVEAGGRQLLPQQSVSKLWVALTVMDLRDQGKIRLDEPIVVRPQDLTLFHQPIAMLVKGDGYRTTVGELLTRALTHSDNTANDRLLTRVGGPSAVRSMITRKQLGAIRFGPGERMLQSGTAGLVWQPSYAVNGGFMTARNRLSPAVREAALNAYVRNPPDGAR